MMEYIQKAKILGLLCLITTLSATLALTTYSGLASAQNKTLMQPTGIKGIALSPTNIVLTSMIMIPEKTAYYTKRVK
ncbi:MAG: hypothetical protein WBQ25_21765 [Nitrososphaeraceae archaeon]